MPPAVRPSLIREAAEEAGFDLVRFGPPDIGEHADHFDRWIDAGRSASMDYLDRNRDRIRDPLSWIPTARSSVCLGYDYGTAEATKVSGGGRVARYARGRDYHRFLGKATARMRKMLEGEGVPHGSVRIGTDAVPILERALAVRSGIGFLAKSSGIINPQHGPYLLLSELITPLDLPLDLPSPGSCGTCTRCIDACPTDAIVAPFEVDARRCLSYTTIEHRGAVPRALREPQGDWLFGCDVCLEVCPFTSKGRGSGAGGVEPRPELRTHPALETYDLVGILTLDQAAWDADWTGTAMRRATRDGLRRNAATVLGNLGDPAALPELRAALDDADAGVREHAAWAIGRIAPRDAALERRLAVEADASVQRELRHALEQR